MSILGKAVSRVVRGDPTGKILYAITGAGISRSKDGGRSWSAAGDVQEGRMIVALNDPDVLFAGKSGSCGLDVTNTPFTASLDGGRTWETLEAGTGIEPLLADAGTPTLLVGTTCALQVSDDGGESWRFVSSTANYDVHAAASSNDTLTDRIAVIGTSEGGTSVAWILDITALTAPVGGDPIAIFFGLGAVDWSGERLVLATTTGVGVSDDRGATWSWSRAGLEDVTFSVDPLTEPIPDDELTRPMGFGIAVIDPSNRDRIWVAGKLGAFRSDDGGKTWSQLGDNSAIDSLVVSTAVDRVYVSSDGGTRAWTLDGH